MAERIEDIRKLWDSTFDDWQEWMTEAEEDFQFRMGDQWSDSDKNKLARENKPALSINIIAKSVNMITGYEKQNKTDIKVFPVEGADQASADVYSELIHWIMTDGGAGYHISQAFENAVTCGIGWLHPCMNYDEDMINGDLKLISESPFRIFPDPEFTTLDLSDCNYIFRNAWLSKESAKGLYPEYAREIEKLKGGDTSQFKLQTPAGGKTHVFILEKWYREYEAREFMVDTSTGEAMEWRGNKEKLNKIKCLMKDSPDDFIDETQSSTYGNLDIIKRRVPVIKMVSICENELVLYDGLNPYKTSRLPFVPIFCYYVPAYNDWKWKLQGIVRNLKDTQREKNKRRSQIMAAVLSMPFSGYIMDKMAVDDISELTTGGAGKIIQKNAGKSLEPIRAPEIPQALITLERMENEDTRSTGLDPDLLGSSRGGSGMSAPGITIQLRQRQGMTILQNIYDMLGFGLKNLGKIMIEMINENYSDEKITRIIGRPIPPQFSETRAEARYDCTVDEVAATPTYRMANFLILSELMQRGIPIPVESLVEATDLPAGVKEKTLANIAQQQQIQQQAAQMQMAQQQAQLGAQTPQAGPMMPPQQ